MIQKFCAIPKRLILLTSKSCNTKEGKAIAQKVDIPVYDLGYLNNDRAKAVAYSAADLFLFPTRADNSPLVLYESMACSTPMVGFDVGGVPDLVHPGITGYLAETENSADFAAGIVQLLTDEPLRNAMSQQCRATVLQEYNLQLQVQRHTHLYQSLVSSNSATNSSKETCLI